MRLKLTIAYRGTNYHGWQQQPATQTWKGPTPEQGAGIPTIQGLLKTALAKVVGHPIILVGSSRTDTGVHAKAQVAAFDTDQTQIPLDGMRRAINARLPGDIIVSDIEAVPMTFDARKSTVCKRYQYLIWNAENRPVFFHDMAWHRWQELNVDAMKTAAAHFIGTHDFASFAKVGHGRESTVRTVLDCSVSYRKPKLVIGVEGTGFLWNMVRIMVGTLVQVGLGNLSPPDVVRMLEAKDRKQGGPTAPAHGLFLQWIKFRIEPPGAVDPVDLAPGQTPGS